MYPILYRDLANHLSVLPLDATCAAFVACCESYTANDPDYWEQNVVAHLRALPPDADWMTAMETLCGLLRGLNPRFVPALMTEWVLEDK